MKVILEFEENEREELKHSFRKKVVALCISGDTPEFREGFRKEFGAICNPLLESCTAELTKKLSEILDEV